MPEQERPRRSARERMGLGLAPLLAAIVWWAPLEGSLEPDAQRLAAIFVGIVTLWVSEALPIAATALLIAPAMIAANIVDAKTAFAPYADPLLFLFVGGFFIARAMSRHGLDRRLANAIVSARFVQGGAAAGRGARVRLAMMMAGVALSMWISNTATTAILAPILLGSLADDEDATGPLLGIGYACSVGGLGTLVGSPPNAIAVRLLSDRVGDFGFVQWMMLGMPTALILVGVVAFVTHKMHPSTHTPALSADARPWSRGEFVTAIAFLLAVVLWMTTGLWKATGDETGIALARALPGGAIAIIAATVLFVARDEQGERVLPWNDAVRIDWGIILLFGGGISLGTQMFETGLARALAEGFVAATGIEGVWTLTIVVTVFTIFFTEVCSNTASATMLVPLVIAIADRIGVSPVAPTLGVALAASCAFMLPIATGPNAIIYGTGRIALPSMMKTGLVLNLACGLGIVAILAVLVPAFGW